MAGAGRNTNGMRCNDCISVYSVCSSEIHLELYKERLAAVGGEDER